MSSLVDAVLLDLVIVLVTLCILLAMCLVRYLPCLNQGTLNDTVREERARRMKLTPSIGAVTMPGAMTAPAA